MSGIKVSTKTKAKATLKLANAFRSYLFEQEYGELNKCSSANKKVLKDALFILDSIIKSSN